LTNTQLVKEVMESHKTKGLAQSVLQALRKARRDERSKVFGPAVQGKKSTIKLGNGRFVCTKVKGK
jgi:hypothetical protein